MDKDKSYTFVDRCSKEGGGKGVLLSEEKSSSICTAFIPTVVYSNPDISYCIQGNCIDRSDTAGCNGCGWKENKSYTLNTIDRPAVVYGIENNTNKYVVRRLTPLECCRLQGFPDWWEQDIVGSDAARYKMWGNGIALPCAVDVLYRIFDYMKLRKDKTQNETCTN